MQNLLEELKVTLQSDERLIIDGHLVKNKVVELSLAVDEGLVALLLTNESIKKHFFKEIGQVLVFDKVAFQSFVSNKQFLPDSYTAFKNKIGLTTDREYLTESKEVVLSWPYKDCVLEGGQTKEDQNRKEIFWNETLAPDEIDRLLEPKVLTNFKKYDKDGEYKVENVSLDDNLIIRGNNLLALHSLKKEYTGKVKLVYIDPPYNTGDDEFNYNDAFTHSTWLTFMKNRLEVAKSLLTNDGVIFVQINDIEYAYLKILLDEVFGVECFQSSICVKMSHLSGPKMAHKDKKIPKIKEHLLMYSKKENGLSLTPQYTPVTWNDAFDRYESFIDKSVDNKDLNEWKPISLNQALKLHGINTDDEVATLKFKMENSENIYQTALNRSKNYPKEPKNKFIDIENTLVLNGREVIFAADKIRDFNGVKKPSSIISDIWADIGINNVFQEGGKDISLRFGKKPEMLLKRIIALVTEEGDTVMDFFLGTGTTCAVAHKMRRKYIGIEQLEYGEASEVNRLNNVIRGDSTGVSEDVGWQGGGSFVYCELAQHNANFIDKIEQADTSGALKSIWHEIERTDFISYKIKPETINENIHEFEALTIEEQKQFLIALLDKNHLYVNYSEIEDEDYQISEDDKNLNKQFYGEV